MLGQLVVGTIFSSSLMTINPTNIVATRDRGFINSTQTNTSKLYNQKSSQKDFHQELLALINSTREERGLGKLRFSESLNLVAQNHAQDLVANNILSHEGSDGSSVADRVLKVGYDYSSIGENVAAGRKTPKQVFQQWLNSPGHKANMLGGNYTEVGIGSVLDASGTTYEHYWVLVLGKEF